MRVLILANVPPGAVGGAEVQALHLAKMLGKWGHTVTVAGYANIECNDGPVQVLRIPIWVWPRVLRGASYLFLTLRLIWHLRNDFDLLYCRFLGEQAIAACLAKMLMRLRQPVVACPACAHEEGEASAIAASPFRRLLIPLFQNNLAAINVMSSRIEREIHELGLTLPRLIRVPNGVVVPPEICSKQVDGHVRLIFVGRLVRQKGVDVLLEALASVALLAVSHFSVDIVGDGPLRKELENQALKLGLDGKINFLGKVSPEDVGQHLARADLFVLPSRFEGLPGSLLEAFAHGLPAVVTKVSGSEDVVCMETGWVVEPDDSEGMAMAILAALERGAGKLNQMGAVARAKAIAQYDVEMVAKRYEFYFEEILANGGGLS